MTFCTEPFLGELFEVFLQDTTVFIQVVSVALSSDDLLIPDVLGIVLNPASNIYYGVLAI